MTKILCIEDEPDLRSVIVEELQDQGFETLEAANGREGLNAITSQKPDLVICDVTMPEMSGYDVLSQLRANYPELADMPFLFLTALGSREDIVAGRAMGADDYLSKPIDFDVLIATVNSRLAQVSRMDTKKQAELEELCNQIFMVLPHEMRTPLNHILGFSQMIAGEMFGPVGNEQYVNYAKQIVAGGTQLLRTIENVLTMADITAGHLVVQIRPHNLADLLEENVESLRLEAGEKVRDIRLLVPEHCPAVETDNELLGRVVFALVSNAVKFSPDGGAIEIIAEEQPEGMVRIRVVDHGIGMTDEEQERALCVFSQVDSGATRSFDGLGLGLPLVTQVCELLNIRFELSSQLGHGTTATLTLPAHGDGEVTNG